MIKENFQSNQSASNQSDWNSQALATWAEKPGISASPVSNFAGQQLMQLQQCSYTHLICSWKAIYFHDFANLHDLQASKLPFRREEATGILRVGPMLHLLFANLWGLSFRVAWPFITKNCVLVLLS